MLSIPKKGAAGLALCFSSGLVSAGDYQQEVIFSYATSDAKYSGNSGFSSTFESDIYLGRYQYYWSPVNPKNMPLAEAGFMTRAAGMGVSVIRASSTGVGQGTAPSRSDSSAKLVAIRASYLAANNTMLAMGVLSGDSEYSSSTGGADQSSKDRAIVLGARHYVGRFTTVGFTMVRSKEDESQEGISYTSDYRVDAKSVLALSGQRFLALQGAVSDMELPQENSARSFDLGAIFYLNARTGIGADFGRIFDEDDGVIATTDYALTLSHFFTDKFSVSASVVRSEGSNDDMDYDDDELSIELLKRF